MKQSFGNRMISLLFAVLLLFLILTAAISLPIYIRPFYYAHIDAMDLSALSGFPKEEIVRSYDAVLDYLTLPGHAFGTGVMAHSSEGAAHFADCKRLFSLNSAVFLTSGAGLLVLTLLRRRLGPYRLGRRPAAFYGGVCAILLPLVVGGLAAVNFDRAFVVFHHIFFPGKDNWLFDRETDQIITVLPQEFFLHCAVLIGAGLLVFASIAIVLSLVLQKREILPAPGTGTEYPRQPPCQQGRNLL